jgi:hypothetical protein
MTAPIQDSRSANLIFSYLYCDKSSLGANDRVSYERLCQSGRSLLGARSLPEGYAIAPSTFQPIIRPGPLAMTPAANARNACR